MFVDQAPQMTSIQFWESWALGNNVTILASNIQIPGYMAVGSGIFHGQDGAFGVYFQSRWLLKTDCGKCAKAWCRSSGTGGQYHSHL
ncbi:biotinidase [Caerostris extrusa]|uniref:Biotinidase n=1 Tax=Caerostris extrusa TaxID=172846 RepID=A0AAV4VHS9_CAEEX|nr:biotinidase [Caerostris extrusa]